MTLLGVDQALRLPAGQVLRLRNQFRPNVQFTSFPDGTVMILYLPDNGYNSGRPTCYMTYGPGGEPITCP